MLCSEWALMSIELEKLAKAGNIKVMTAGWTGENVRITSMANNVPAGSDLFLASPTGMAAAIGIGSESMVKFSSSAGYSRVWTVQLELAEDGDCGSWAVNRKGELLGMLIGSCDVAREEYILPARTFSPRLKRPAISLCHCLL